MNNFKVSLFAIFTLTIPLWHVFPQESNYHVFKTKTNNSSILSPNLLNKVKSLTDFHRFFNPKTLLTGNSSDIIIDSAIFVSTSGKDKITYEYDNQSRISSFTWTYWLQNKWTNMRRVVETYDSLGNLQLELSAGWDLDYWRDDSRETYAYDSYSNLISDLSEIMNDSQWVNSFMITYQYDSSGFLRLNQLEYWDSTGWNNSSRASMYYDDHGNRDSILIESWSDGQWINDVTWNLVYENPKAIISYLSKTWDNNQWVNSERGNFKCNSNGQWVYGLYQSWDGIQWLDDLRFNYSYNSNNYFTHGLNEIYNNGIWVPGDAIFSISEPDLRIGIISSELTIYYKTTSILDKQPDTFGFILSQNYPNPFNPSTTINFTIPYSGFVQIKIYNILGKEIKTIIKDYKSKGSYKVNFDASGLPSGIYIYQLKSGSYNKSNMMILQK